MADKYTMALMRQKGIEDKPEQIGDVMEFQSELQSIITDFISRHNNKEYKVLLSSILNHYSVFLIKQSGVNDDVKLKIVEKFLNELSN